MRVIAEIDAYEDDRPSPERAAAGKMAYDRVLNLIADLPDRCRKIVQLRKIEGWSQKQIAAHLGTTEKAVEKQIWLGIRHLREEWGRSERDASDRFDHLGKREGGR